MPILSSSFFVPISELTFTAFYNPKPLFTPEEKPAAAKLIEECLPQINKGYVYFRIEILVDKQLKYQDPDYSILLMNLKMIKKLPIFDWKIWK